MGTVSPKLLLVALLTLCPLLIAGSKCRGPLDLHIVSDGRIEGGEFGSIIDLDREILRILPGKLSAESQPDRYGWWRWMGDIEPASGFELLELQRIDIDFQGSVFAVNVVADGSVEGDSDPGTGLKKGWEKWEEDFQDRSEFVQAEDVAEGTRCLFFIKYSEESNVGSLVQATENMKDSRCVTILWYPVWSPKEEPWRNSIEQAALRQVRPVVENRVLNQWGTNETDFFMETEGFLDATPGDPDEIARQIATIANASAFWDEDYCNSDLYTPSESSGSFDPVTAFFLVGAGLLLLIALGSLISFFAARSTEAPSGGPPTEVPNDFAEPTGTVKFAKKKRPLTQDERPGLMSSTPKYAIPQGAALRLAYFQALLSFEAGLQRAFAWSGRVVVRAPQAVMLSVLIFSFAITATSLQYMSTTDDEWFLKDMEGLWAEPDSPARDASNFLAESFSAGLLPRVTATMILESKEGGNVLTPEGIADLDLIDNELRAHPEYAFRDGATNKPTCYFSKVPDKCHRLSATDFWRPPADDTIFVPGVPVPPIEALPVDEDELFERTFDANRTYIHGAPIWRNDVLEAPVFSWECKDRFCGGDWNSDTPDEVWAEHGNTSSAFRLTYYRLPGGLTSESWDEFFLEYEPAETSTLRIVSRGHEGYLKDEVESASNSPPILMFIATFAAIILFIVRVFVANSAIDSRVCLGMSGLFGTIMSIVTGICLLVLLGSQVSITTVIVPVVIMSIGVDDMFLIVDAFDETNPLDPLALRVPEALQTCGLAISMTTLTDALAFGVGTFSSIPAVQSMSAFAMACVVIDFVYQVFWFGSALVLDATRQEAERSDWACPLMFCDCGKTMESREPAVSNAVPFLGEDEEANGEHGGHEEVPDGFLGEVLGPWVASLEGRTVVVGTTLALVVFGVWSLTWLNIGLNTSETLLESSTLGQFWTNEREVFGEPVTMPIDFVHRNPKSGNEEGVPLMPSEKAQNDAMTGFHEELDDEWAVPGSVLSWWNEFAVARNAPVPEDDFVSEYQQWLAQPLANSSVIAGAAYGADSNVQDDGYVSSRSTATLLPISNFGWTSVRSLQGLYERMDELGWSAFSQNLLLAEPNNKVFGNLLKDMVITLIIVFCVSVLFLQHPMASVILSVTLLSVMTNVAAALVLFGVPLSSFTQVVLVIAMGLSIDYISHIAHAFVSAPGDRGAKAVIALAAHGPAIFNGMITTAAGMLALILLGHVGIIRTFGTTVLIVQIVGLYHAFIVLPTFLAWIGPLTYRNPVAAVLVQQQMARIYSTGKTQKLDLTKIRRSELIKVQTHDIRRADADALKAAMIFKKQIRKSQDRKRANYTAKSVYVSLGPSQAALYASINESAARGEKMTMDFRYSMAPRKKRRNRHRGHGRGRPGHGGRGVARPSGPSGPTGGNNQGVPLGAAGAPPGRGRGSGRAPPKGRTSTGSSRRAPPGAGRRPSNGSGRKGSSGSGRKGSTGSGRKGGSGSGRKGGSGRKAPQ